MANFKKDFKKEWITEGIKKDCVDYTEKLGKHLCALDDRGRAGRDALTTSQIRNFFGEVKRIQNVGIEKTKSKSAFILIRPKLAYATARVTQRNYRSRITTFREVVEEAYQHVDIENAENRKKHFQNFVDFLESTLAFHKVYGGRD